MPFETPTAKRQTTRATRYRALDGTYLPSVTQILDVAKPDMTGWANALGKRGIDHKEHLNSLARAGTLLHAKIEAQLRGLPAPDESEYSQDEQAWAFRSFFHWSAWANSHTVRPLALELPLVSEIHRYGGTVDAIAEVDDCPVILDWKSSARPYLSHLLQLSAYQHLIREHRGLNLAVAVICCPRENGGWSETRLEPDERMEALFDAFLQAKGLHDRLAAIERQRLI